MTGFLLDTNVPSELTRPKPEPEVIQWLDDADDLLSFSASFRWERFSKASQFFRRASAASNCSNGSTRLCAPGSMAAFYLYLSPLLSAGEFWRENVS